MDEKTLAIVEFLKQEELPFHEALRLYSQHPNARRNVVTTTERRFRHSTTHEKIVYELEKIASYDKFSGRKTVLKESPINTHHRIIKETELKAPSNFEYKIKFEDLPKDKQALVIEKGKLYDAREIAKKEMGAVGTGNDDASVQKRQALRADIKSKSDRIVEIHQILVAYDNGEEKEQEPAKKVVIPDNSPESILEKEFRYSKMNDAEKKLLLKKLQSDASKQRDRANTSKKETTREKNAKLAAQNEKLIEFIQNDLDAVSAG